MRNQSTPSTHDFMKSIAMTTNYIAFPLPDTLLSKSNRFLEAVSARDSKAGTLFVEASNELTDMLIDILLLQPLEQSSVGSVGEKLVRLCANTGGKVSHMLSGKLFNKASMEELIQVAELWQSNLKDFNDGKGWRMSTPIAEAFAVEIDEMLAERGDTPEFIPKDMARVVRAYEKLSDILIDEMFLGHTRKLKLGMVMNGVLNTGVSSVKSAIHSVMHNVIGKLHPKQLAEYVDHTTQFRAIGE